MYGVILNLYKNVAICPAVYVGCITVGEIARHHSTQSPVGRPSIGTFRKIQDRPRIIRRGQPARTERKCG